MLEAFAEALPRKDNKGAVARELAQIVGEVPTHHLTALHISATVARWKERYSRNTIYVRGIALRGVLRHYEQTTGTHGHVAAMPRLPSPQQRNITATPDELDALHRFADPFLRLWLRITVAFALSQVDVRKLSPANYNAENKTISFHRTKTGEPQTLPVPHDLAAIFEDCPEDTDPETPFLIRFNGGRKISPGALRKRWRTLKSRAGVRAELNPHDLRRTTAAATYQLTHDLRIVQQLLGHQSLRPTVSYLGTHDPAALRPILAQLWTPKTKVTQ